ncbi:hypothetical protein AB4291_18915 [Vibrio cyclitrophicus]
MITSAYEKGSIIDVRTTRTLLSSLKDQNLDFLSHITWMKSTRDLQSTSGLKILMSCNL